MRLLFSIACHYDTTISYLLLALVVSPLTIIPSETEHLLLREGEAKGVVAKGGKLRAHFFLSQIYYRRAETNVLAEPGMHTNVGK